MAELRWHPLIKDWVMIASHRQNRPQMPMDWCPFCPGSGRVPEHYDVASKYYHFHIEFFPPMRTSNKQKFNASSETGAWAHTNPTKPEEKAEELRNAHKRFISQSRSCLTEYL